MIVELEHPLIGVVKSIAAPMRFESNGPTYRRYPPRLGEHNAEIRRTAADVVSARRLAFPDVLQVRAEAGAELRMTQTVLDGRAQVADLAAAVVANTA